MSFWKGFVGVFNSESFGAMCAIMLAACALFSGAALVGIIIAWWTDERRKP